MKQIFTISFIILISTSLNAQEWTFTPRIGLNTMKQKIQFNNLPSYYPGSNESFIYGFKMNYQGKKGHGMYFGVSAFNAGHRFSYIDPYNHQFKYFEFSSPQRRLDIGYQWSSKPVYFKNLLDNKINSEAFNSMENKGWYFKFQPFIGAGLNFTSKNASFNKSDTATSVWFRAPAYMSPSYSLGFDLELGKNGNKKIILSAQYSHLIANSFYSSIHSNVNGIEYRTQAFSRPSWSFTVGMPITFKPKKCRIAPEKKITALRY